MQGAGSSSLQKTYSFTDPQVHSGSWYYRLKLVHVNGKTSQYSAVVRVESNPGKASLEYFPNPARKNITVMVNDKQKGSLQIRLIAMDGKVMMQKQWMKKEETITAVLDVQQLTRGIYLMEVSVGDQMREIRKIIKE